MSRLLSVMGMALDDAARAEGLVRDVRAREALRSDPERTLQMFELRSQEIAESIAVRMARREQRDLGVVAASRRTVSGSRLPA